MKEVPYQTNTNNQLQIRGEFQKDIVEKVRFQIRGHAVSSWCILLLFPYGATFALVRKQLAEAEEEHVIRRLISQCVNWMETDNPEMLMTLLDRIDEEDASL